MKNNLLTPIPSSISYLWNFGSTLMTILIIQLISGVIISMNYNSSIEMAFYSVDRMMRYVDNGWIMRLIHVNGASLYFASIYLHMFRSIYFKSWVHYKVWNTGMIILLMSMASAFLGYVLPWGQMSFWAATVITNLFSAIPLVGPKLVTLIWGSFAVSFPTLNRFFTLHFLIPLMISTMVMIHLLTLHKMGSSNPLGISMNKDKMYFHPLFSMKDLITMILAVSIILMITLMNPFMSMDSDNFSMSNPLLTPEHIQPEWYFLFAYSILRAIPSKLGGVIAMLMSLIIFMLKPLMKTNKKFNQTMIHKTKMYMFVISFTCLSFLGANPAEEPFSKLMKIFSTTYFISALMM